MKPKINFDEYKKEKSTYALLLGRNVSNYKKLTFVNTPSLYTVIDAHTV